MVDPARLDELRRHFEGNPRRYFAPLASALRRSGDARGAVALARAQLAVYPGHLTGHVILGQALLELGDAGAARDAFARAAELDAGNVVALQQLLALARDAGDAVATSHWTGRLVEADPELAAEVTGTAADGGFEPLDLEAVASDGGDPFTAATLDPRLSVDASRAAAAGARMSVDVDPDIEPAPFAADWPQDAATRPEAGPDAPAVAADAADLPTLDAVVGLDVPPADPLPPEMRDALPALLDEESVVARSDASGEGGAVDGPAVGEGPIVAPPAAPFITETMAALLASQGHTSQAVDVYERLLEQRPDDERLRARLAALRGAPLDAETAGAVTHASVVGPADDSPDRESPDRESPDRESPDRESPDRESPEAGPPDASESPVLEFIDVHADVPDAPDPPAEAAVHGANADVAGRADAPDRVDVLDRDVLGMSDGPHRPDVGAVPTSAALPHEAPDDADERAARMWRAAFARLPREAEVEAAAFAAEGAPPPADTPVDAPVEITAGVQPDAPGEPDAAFDDLSFDRFFADTPEPDPAGEFERWAADAARAGSSAFDLTPPTAAGAIAAEPVTSAAAAPAGSAAPAHPAPDDPDEDLAQFNAWLRGLAE